MKKLMMTLVTGLAAALMLGGCATTAEGYGEQKVVYHMNSDDPKQQTATLRNIQNHINAVGKDNLDMRVVMHGNGLSMVLLPDALQHTKGFKTANADPQRQADIDNLKLQGVKFQICANTIKGRNVNAANDLYDFAETDVVPSGVAELSHLQRQGFTYVKP